MNFQKARMNLKVFSLNFLIEALDFYIETRF
jgi:hypothetical protein